MYKPAQILAYLLLLFEGNQLAKCIEATCPYPTRTNSFITNMCMDEPMSSLAGQELQGKCFSNYRGLDGEEAKVEECFNVKRITTSSALEFQVSRVVAESMCPKLKVRAMRVQVIELVDKRNFGSNPELSISRCGSNWYPDSFVVWESTDTVISSTLSRRLVWDSCSPNCGNIGQRNLFYSSELLLENPESELEENRFLIIRICEPKRKCEDRKAIENTTATVITTTLPVIASTLPVITTTLPVTTTTLTVITDPTTTRAKTTKPTLITLDPKTAMSSKFPTTSQPIIRTHKPPKKFFLEYVRYERLQIEK